MNKSIGISVLAVFQRVGGGLLMLLISVFTLVIEYVTLKTLIFTADITEDVADIPVWQDLLFSYTSGQVLAAVTLLIGAIGLWRLKRWGWFLSLLAWSLNLAIAIAQMIASYQGIKLLGGMGAFPTSLRIILSILIIGYLILPRVKGAFLSTLTKDGF